jgi:6-pyruvoyltetrahydropterin/6-carboxytetrahydropterin synthase
LANQFTIEKTFFFEAAHRLDGLPEGHKCARLHGHSYRVKVRLEKSVLDEHGFVRDYGDLDIVNAWIQGTLDHQDLNQVCDFPTTAEKLAEWIYGLFKKRIPELTAVGVSETIKSDTWAWYHGFR